MEFFLVIFLGLAFPILVVLAYLRVLSRRAKVADLEIDKTALAEAENALRETDERDWVVLKRCHGPAYNHSAMVELVSALNAEGIEATYDVVASSSADGGVTNYMLKVIREHETQAREVLLGLENV